MSSSTTAESNSKSPKEKAVDKVLWLIGFGFVISLLIGSALPKLISLIQTPGQTFSDIKSLIEMILKLVVGGPLLVFLVNEAKTTITDVIDNIKNEEIKEYKQQNPKIEDLREKQKQEYVTVVTSQQFSKNIASRYAIIARLAYDDKMLRKIALIVTRDVFNQPKEFSNEQNFFRNDIYIYLKAWLMLSIYHEYEMPVESIKQSYPNIDYYVKALKAIDEPIKDLVLPSLDEKHQESAFQILQDYRDHLIDLIKNKETDLNRL
jgi:hypothetical protein